MHTSSLRTCSMRRQPRQFLRHRRRDVSESFDAHPPVQIDGNFGAVFGITEMLLQSHTGETVSLPALPKAWPTGSVKGLVLRAGVTFRCRTIGRSNFRSTRRPI